MKPTPFETRLVKLLLKNSEDYIRTENKNNIDIALLGVDGGLNEKADFLLNDLELPYQIKTIKEKSKQKQINIKDIICYCLKDEIIAPSDFEKITSWLGKDFFEKMSDELAETLWPRNLTYHQTFKKNVINSTLFNYAFSRYFTHKEPKFINWFISNANGIRSGESIQSLLKNLIQTNHYDICESLIKKLSFKEVKFLLENLSQDRTEGTENIPFESKHHKRKIQLYLNYGGDLLDVIPGNNRTLLADIEWQVSEGIFPVEDLNEIKNQYLTEEKLNDAKLKEEALYFYKLATNYQNSSTSGTFKKGHASWDSERWEGIPLYFYCMASRYVGNKTIENNQKAIRALNSFDDQGISVMAYLNLVARDIVNSSKIEEDSNLCKKIRGSLSHEGLYLLNQENESGFIVQRLLASRNLEKALNKAQDILDLQESKRIHILQTPIIYDPRPSNDIEHLKWPVLSQILFGKDDIQNEFFEYFKEELNDYNQDYIKHDWGKIVIFNTLLDIDGEEESSVKDLNVKDFIPKKQWHNVVQKLASISRFKKPKAKGFMENIAEVLCDGSTVGWENLNQTILQNLLPCILNYTMKQHKDVSMEFKNYFESLKLNEKWLTTNTTCEDFIRSFLKGIEETKQVMELVTTHNEEENKSQGKHWIQRNAEGLLEKMVNIEFLESLLDQGKIKQKIMDIEIKDSKTIKTNQKRKLNI
jgi:hypothetical protein